MNLDRGGGLIYETSSLSAENTLKELHATYVMKKYITYPIVFFPEHNITSFKRKIIDELKLYIIENGGEWVNEGIYRIYIEDFSDADLGTNIMFLNDIKKQYSIIPIHFDNAKQKLQISMPLAGRISKTLDDDYDCGGIQYSELFSRLSVEEFEYKIS